MTDLYRTMVQAAAAINELAGLFAAIAPPEPVAPPCPTGLQATYWARWRSWPGKEPVKVWRDAWAGSTVSPAVEP